jgi:cell division protein FtsB
MHVWLRVLMNRYILAVVVFLVNLLFLDDFSLPNQYGIHKKIKQLESEKEFYQQEIDRLNIFAAKWSNSPDEAERYARESFMMKKPNEDVFILVSDEENTY